MTGTTVTCPKCGHEQPASAECTACGVIFAKYNPNAPSALHPRSSLSQMNRDYRRPIGPGSRAVRVLMALGTAGVALLLALTGLLEHGFEGYVAMVLFTATVAYFGLSSFLETISRNRYYGEAAVFILLLTGVRIYYDPHFGIDDVIAPAANVSTGDPSADLANAVDAALTAARGHLAGRDFPAVERCCLEHTSLIEARLARVSGTERIRANTLVDEVTRLSRFVMSDAPWNDARAREFGALLDALSARLQDYRARR